MTDGQLGHDQEEKGNDSSGQGIEPCRRNLAQRTDVLSVGLCREFRRRQTS
jgi:hypothetical protein